MVSIASVRRASRLVLALGLLLLLASGAAAAVQATDTGLDGRILFVKDGDLWVVDGSGWRQLATGGSFSQPSWGPDGTLAYVYRGTNFADIFITDDQGQSQFRLTTSQSTVLDNNDWNLRPSWSPDGKLIAFVSDHSTTFPVLWTVDPSDPSTRRPLATPGIQQEMIDAITWSPDASELAVTVYNDPGPTQIAVVPVPPRRELAHVVTETPGGALDPAWSPDGDWLAFAGRDGYATEIYAMHPDGSGVQKLTSDGTLSRSPAWSPDGRHVAYVSNHGGNFEIWVLDVNVDANGNLTPSSPRQVTRELSVDAASGLSWGR